LARYSARDELFPSFGHKIRYDTIHREAVAEDAELSVSGGFLPAAERCHKPGHQPLGRKQNVGRIAIGWRAYRAGVMPFSGHTV